MMRDEWAQRGLLWEHKRGRIDRTTTTRMTRDRLVSGGILDGWVGVRINPSRISTSRSWRKSVVLTKGLRLGARWAALVAKLDKDPSVTPRLRDQALACLCAYKGLDYDHERALAQVKVASPTRLEHARS